MNPIKLTISSGLLVAGLLIAAGSAQAAGRNDGFAAFWAQFRDAVSKGDQNAVSQMVKYPVFYIDQRKADDFPLVWKGAFKPAQRACLAKQKPTRDTHEGKLSYSAFCGSLIYAFGKSDAGWRLTDIDEDD